MWAAQYNAPDVAKLLIDKGGDINETGNANNKVRYFAEVVQHALQQHHQWCE